MKHIALRLAGASLFTLVPLQHLFAEDTAALKAQEVPAMVVTAQRYPTAAKNIPTSVTVIDSKQIESSYAQTVGEVLQGVPGIDVVQSGGAGGNTAVFLRGANSEHTLVYIDGVEANDPITATRTFDFANLGVENIDHIEVVRGPQSVLYGSDAIGGVILITTKKGCGAPSGIISAEGGSYGTFNERASVSGGDEDAVYSLAVSQRNTDGFSAASKKTGNTEKDGYESTNLSGLLMVTPSKFFDMTFTLRYANARTELDNFGGIGGDDSNRVLFSNNLVSRLEAGTHLLDGVLNQKIGFSFTDQWFDDNNGVDAAHPVDAVTSDYTGKMAKFDIQNILKISPELSGVLGYENKTEMGSSSYVSTSLFGPYTDILSDRSVTSNGYYGQASWQAITWDDTHSVVATAGARIDEHTKFGSKTTWKAGPVVNLGDTKVSGSVGTGYKAPSIYQLYSSYGNENLQPEESTGWDVGVEQSLSAYKTVIGVTWFHNDFKNLITFNPNTFVSENINRARSQGIEGYGTIKVIQNVSLDGSYTFTDTEDKGTGADLLRRPRNKGKVGIRYSPTEKLQLGVEGLFRGKSHDNDFSTFPATTTSLAGYVTVAVSANYKVNKEWEIFGRGENIFDRQYEDVLGYGKPGATVMGGVRYYFE